MNIKVGPMKLIVPAGWPADLGLIDEDNPMLKKLREIEEIEERNGGRNPDALLPRLRRRWHDFVKNVFAN